MKKVSFLGELLSAIKRLTKLASGSLETAVTTIDKTANSISESINLMATVRNSCSAAQYYFMGEKALLEGTVSIVKAYLDLEGKVKY